MASPVENIVQHLFQTDSLENVSVQQIQQVINNHPYYGAAYFLLAKKLRSSNQDDYNTAIQKTALHFSNTAWLNFNLQDEDEQVVTTLPAFFDEAIVKKDKVDAGIVEEKNIAEENETNVAEISVAQEISTHDSIIGNTQATINNDDEAFKNISETEPVTVEEIPFQQEVATPNNSTFNAVTEETATTEDDAGDDEVETEQTDIENNDAVSKKLSSILQEQAKLFEKPAEPVTEIPIENTPYHRVDYFDSQGIKLEEKPDDKLGTQLKRFTDWLKQMKRANPNQIVLENDVAGETQVQNIAQHSNQPEEIVTETMAEVLIKQGKPEQAIQIYEKLSFNNPSKTAYFAAKIKELKG